MPKLTTKAKIAFQFSIFITLFILISSTIFTIAYYILINRNIKDSLIQESKEIVAQYLIYDQNRLIYQKDKNNDLLSEHLQYDNFSVIIYNDKEEVIGSFGVFQNKETDNPLKDFISTTIKTKQYQFAETFKLFEERQYEVISYPIIFENKVVGVIQIAKETNFITTFFRTYFLLLAILLPLGILGSWILVYLVSIRTFRPITNLANTMSEISTHNLDKKVAFNGNQNDELFKLSDTFNLMMDRIKLGFEKQQQFIANASHELKTPLTRAISSLDIITLNKINQKDLVIINDTKKELFKLNNVLKNLLFLSKTTDTSSVITQKFVMASSIKEVLKSFQKEITHKKLQIDTSSMSQEKIEFPVEYFLILMSNIISNAIKYSHSGGKISISTKTQEKQNSITVTDYGIGMNPEEKEHIFDRFYRGKSVSLKAEGSGLGMSIVKTIVDLYNLKITITSTREKGTTVTISNFRKAS